jgi:hypothetical protein
MSGWPSIPFDCGVSLQQRWDAFKAILSSNTTKLVTYNATVSLLPLYHHLIHDRKLDGDSVNDCMMHLTGELGCSQGKNFHQTLAPDDCLYSIWDLRLVSWVSFDEALLLSFPEPFSPGAIVDAPARCIRCP